MNFFIKAPFKSSSSKSILLEVRFIDFPSKEWKGVLTISSTKSFIALKLSGTSLADSYTATIWLIVSFSSKILSIWSLIDSISKASSSSPSSLFPSFTAYLSLGTRVLTVCIRPLTPPDIWSTVSTTWFPTLIDILAILVVKSRTP